MDKIHARWNHSKQVLSMITIAVLAFGVLSIGFILEDVSALHKPQKVKAKVVDATTEEPIEGADCSFTFGSGDSADDDTNEGGVANVKDPDPESDETTVDVTCTFDSNSASVDDAPVKKHGTTVIRLLLGATTTTTTTVTETIAETTVTETIAEITVTTTETTTATTTETIAETTVTTTETIAETTVTTTDTTTVTTTVTVTETT
jgi:hypothetical protein